MAGRQTSTGAVHRPARDDGVLAIHAGSELPRLQNTDWEDGCCGKSHLWGKYCKERYRPRLIGPACVAGHVTSRRWRPCEAAEIDSTDSEPLHNLADVLVRAVAEEQVHVIRGDLARDDLEIVLGRDLPQKVTSPDRDRARQHPLAVLGDPDEVNLEIITRVAAKAVSSHDATSPTFPFA